MLVCFFFFFY